MPVSAWAMYKIDTYPTSGWSKADAMKALKMERRLELAMEGHRYFDLVRWGEAQSVLNAYVAVEKTKRAYLAQAAPVQERHNAYPLPIIQIELSTISNGEGTVEERLVQNEGW
ncbi:MAG: RagB/SusD family nutrient uptake outer membrane protein [Cyclobacteriaceae bacterium]|nr:RagB/SusD family nutrient uptake outer membrane protein [Cyclobacteriaceae bacterium]